MGAHRDLIYSVVTMTLLCLAAPPALAREAGERRSRPSTWRRAAFVYEHVVGMDGDDPSYAQGFSFRPRVTFLDGYFAALRLDLDVGLRASEPLDQQAVTRISDLQLDLGYDTPELQIPVFRITIGPRFRVVAPTAEGSRDRGLHAALSPAVRFARRFRLTLGQDLPAVELSYRFRSTWYAIDEEQPMGWPRIEGQAALITDVDDPALHQLGRDRFPEWRLEHAMGLKIYAATWLEASAHFVLLDDFNPSDLSTVLGLFDLTLRPLAWLWASVGVSHAVVQSRPAAVYRPTNDATTVHLAITLPLDGVISTVRGE